MARRTCRRRRRSTPRQPCARPKRSGATGAGRCADRRAHGREPVLRSLITLKALTYRPTGGIVAAPTTSLPEQLGGVAQLGLPLLLAARRDLHADRADERRLPRRGARLARVAAARASPATPAQMQIMYGLAGERRLPEWEVPWLAGYEGAKPVRVGNAAAEQLQLDVYGEVMDALYHGRARQARRRATTAGDLQRALARSPRDNLGGAGRGHLGSARATGSISPIPR